jgi:hypothetical protein
MHGNRIDSVLKKAIIALGDVCFDVMQHEFEASFSFEKPPRAKLNFGQPEIRFHSTPGGAWLINGLLDRYRRFSGGNFDIFSTSQPDFCSDLHPSPYTTAFLQISKYPERGGAMPEAVYRVLRYIGVRSGDAELPRAFLDTAPIARTIASDGTILTIINAHNVRVGSNKSADAKPPSRSDSVSTSEALIDVWSKRDECSRLVQEIESFADGRQYVILKARWPIERIVWKALPDLRERLLVVLTAEDLRSAGIKLSRSVSWDRTASDIVEAFRDGPLKSLDRYHNVLIRFGIDGAIHKQGKEVVFYYDPAIAEGEFEQQLPGKMSGFGCVFCASLAIDFQNNFNDIDTAIRQALAATRQLLKCGYKISRDGVGIDHYEVFNRTDQANRLFARMTVPTDSYLHKSPGWGFLNAIAGNSLTELAKGIVRTGNIPPDTYGVPVARFSKLETLDRSEIENYRGVRNLFNEFIGSTVDRPLSIAVFGQPGTGKSFGVREVAKSLDPKTIEVGLVFNVAQFTSVDDLTSAFHIVRDAALKGKIPLVFFDEFDANVESQQLAWLKYFLAPMQDGLFKDGEAMHPIGKAILVFAGGRSHTFEQFRDQFKPHEQSPPVYGYASEGLERDAKLPDFISRLRGHVNIIGPNPRSGGHDDHFIVRRAMLMRSLLVEKWSHLLRGDTIVVDEGVLNAFLRVPNYRHAVRSMEALIEMSMLSGKRRFDKSALPTEDQMGMHVDAESFNELLNVF